MNDEQENERQEHLKRIRLIHKNLGHPPNRLLAKVFKEAGAPNSTVQQALEFNCEICARMQQTPPAQPVTLNKARELGECISVDFSYLDFDPADINDQTTHKLLLGHIVDESSRFHVCKVLKEGRFQNDRAIGNVNSNEFTNIYSR